MKQRDKRHLCELFFLTCCNQQVASYNELKRLRYYSIEFLSRNNTIFKRVIKLNVRKPTSTGTVLASIQIFCFVSSSKALQAMLTGTPLDIACQKMLTKHLVLSNSLRTLP